jgi:hypothetical protein
MECPGRYLGLSGKKFEEDWKYCIKNSCFTCASHHAGLFFRCSNQGGQPVQCMQHARKNITVCKFLVRSPEENIF